MKNIILILSVLFFFTGCNEEETKQVAVAQDNSIYGTWQLKEQWAGNVGDVSVNWSEAVNEDIINFHENNRFSSSRPPVCPSDITNTVSFSLNTINNNDVIIISFSCLDIEYLYSFDNNYLILSPFSHPCDEGCSFRYIKIASK